MILFFTVCSSGIEGLQSLWVRAILGEKDSDVEKNVPKT